MYEGSQHVTLLVLLDLSAAFDTADIHTYIQFIEAPFPGLFSHNILTKTNKYTERIELNY